MATPAWISLGSNLGDRRAILDRALLALEREPGVTFRSVSSYHETAPVGGPPGQGPFLNAAAKLETTLEPGELLAVLQRVENEAGRIRTVRWGERTLDLDILMYASKFLDEKDLKLPHPRLAFRRFVLAPLAEIAPAAVDTMTKQTVVDLLANLDRRPRLVALDGPKGPLKSDVFRGLVERLPAIGIEANGRDNPGGWSATSRESLAERVEAFQVDRQADRDRWAVAAFFLDPRFIESHANPAPEKFLEFDSMSEVVARKLAEREWTERIRRAKEGAAEPTFVVILPGSEGMVRRPGRLITPQLRPESDDPHAIVAEVLATCRGIDGL